MMTPAEEQAYQTFQAATRKLADAEAQLAQARQTYRGALDHLHTFALQPKPVQ